MTIEPINPNKIKVNSKYQNSQLIIPLPQLIFKFAKSCVIPYPKSTKTAIAPNEAPNISPLIE